MGHGCTRMHTDKTKRQPLAAEVSGLPAISPPLYLSRPWRDENRTVEVRTPDFGIITGHGRSGTYRAHTVRRPPVESLAARSPLNPAGPQPAQAWQRKASG